jgi:RNA polymerase sigma-70 factor (ECF subfamily)
LSRHDAKLTFRFGASGSYRSAEAFSGLYERTHLIVFRYIYALHGEPQEDVEDLWLETYFRAWRSRQRFTGDDDAALGWLLRIARNLVIDQQRRHRRRPVEALLDAERHPAPADDQPENRLMQAEQMRALWAALSTLPDQQREMVVLRYVVGWRVTEIARHLNMAENTVTVALRRALKKLSDQEGSHGS